MSYNLCGIKIKWACWPYELDKRSTMKYYYVKLTYNHLAYGDLCKVFHAEPVGTLFCSKDSLILFAFFPVVWVYGFFLKVGIPASCWAKCVLTTATDIWEKWRIIPQCGFGMLWMRILRYFSLALPLISNGSLKEAHRKAFFCYFITLKKEKEYWNCVIPQVEIPCTKCQVRVHVLNLEEWNVVTIQKLYKISE